MVWGVGMLLSLSLCCGWVGTEVWEMGGLLRGEGGRGGRNGEGC